MPERTQAGVAAGTEPPPIQGMRNYDVKPPDELIRFMSEGWAPPPPVSSEPHPAVANFASRRAQISNAFPNADLVIPTGIPKVRSSDDLYRFRPGSDFFWLTGHDEPDSVLVMRATDEGHQATLYVEPRADRTTPGFFIDAHRGELWVGPRRGLEETSTYLGIDCAPLAQLKDDLSALEATKAIVLRGYDPEIDATVPGHEADAGLATALSELRLIKDDHEVRQLERAVAATVRGFEDIVRALPDAMERGERVVEGVFGTPYYRRRHSWGPNQSSTPRQPRSVARREQRVPTGESQPGSTPPAPQAAPQAAAPARPATTASTAPPVQPLE